MDLSKLSGGVIGCISTKDSKTSPEGQVNCTIEKCEGCSNPIWVSEKKRMIRKEKPELVTLCMNCAVVVMGVLEEMGGTKINIVDVSKPKD